MKVNSRNAKAKLAALRVNVEKAAFEGIRDAGAFLMAKLKDETLNSPGHDKGDGGGPQPPHEPSKGRFVRRRTGDLVGSVQMKVEGEKVVISMNQSRASYAATVNEWAKRKYGRGYMEIATKTYGKLVQTTVGTEIGRAIKAADNLKTYVYQNHFPV